MRHRHLAAGAGGRGRACRVRRSQGKVQRGRAAGRRGPFLGEVGRHRSWRGLLVARRARRGRRSKARQRFGLNDRRRRYLFAVRRLARYLLLHRLIMRYGELLLQLTDQLQLEHLLMLQGVQGALQQRQILEGSLGVRATGQRCRRELCDSHFRVLKGFQGDVTSSSRWEQAGRRPTIHEIIVILGILPMVHLLSRSFLVIVLIVLLVHAFLLILVALMRPGSREIHGFVSASSCTATLFSIRRKIIFLSCNMRSITRSFTFILYRVQNIYLVRKMERIRSEFQSESFQRVNLRALT